MTHAPRSSGEFAQVIPALGLALLAIAVTAVALPWMGHDLGANAAAIPRQASTQRLALLLTSYALVGLAAYRHSGDAMAAAVAVLLGAALGWAGWEWISLSLGWPLFALLVLLQTWPGERPAFVALGVIICWAMLESSAAWGALLLIASAAGGTPAQSRRRVLFLGAGLLACAILVVREVDLRATLLPVVRPWVWADGQARNSAADPAGLAIFALLLSLLGLRLLRPGQVSSGLTALALFGYLAWHMRRNGVWLGLAATPVLAAALGGDWSKTILSGRSARAALLAAATMVGGTLLVAASLVAPGMIGGTPLPEATLRAVPAAGLIVYRPEFEPALLRVRPRSTLALARSPDTTTYAAWERIAANCTPAEELERLQAEAIVLDAGKDATVIATLESAGWQAAGKSTPAVVLLPPEKP